MINEGAEGLNEEERDREREGERKGEGEREKGVERDKNHGPINIRKRYNPRGLD